MSPDMTLCLWRKECPWAGLCERIQAEPDEWHQSYFAPDKRGEDCPYFIEAKQPPPNEGEKSS